MYMCHGERERRGNLPRERRVLSTDTQIPVRCLGSFAPWLMSPFAHRCPPAHGLWVALLFIHLGLCTLLPPAPQNSREDTLTSDDLRSTARMWPTGSTESSVSLMRGWLPPGLCPKQDLTPPASQAPHPPCLELSRDSQSGPPSLAS